MEKVKTIPMPEERLTYLRGFGYTQDSVYPYYPIEDLKKRLFEVGGEAVIAQGITKQEFKAMIREGEFVDGSGAKLWKQRAGDCHGNVEQTYKQYKDKGKADKFVPMTGFALSEDGAWRYHSWLYDNDLEKIVETTVERLVYFGVVDKEVLTNT